MTLTKGGLDPVIFMEVKRDLPLEDGELAHLVAKGDLIAIRVEIPGAILHDLAAERPEVVVAGPRAKDVGRFHGGYHYGRLRKHCRALGMREVYAHPQWEALSAVLDRRIGEEVGWRDIRTSVELHSIRRVKEAERRTAAVAEQREARERMKNRLLQFTQPPEDVARARQLLAAKPLLRIDVNKVDGVWGWEAYTRLDARESEDSGDCEMGSGRHEDDASILLGVLLELSNPVQEGCELNLYREGEKPRVFRWDSAHLPEGDYLDETGWKRVEA